MSSYKKSIPYLERALTIKEKVYGKSSLECSKSYEAMGNSYFGTKDFDKALKSYEKSLSIYRELYKEPGNILISNALFLLGLTHFEKNEYKLSIDSLEKSLEVLKKVKNLVDIKLETAKV